ncbi:MAG: hypothetical protein LBB10_02050, partial [Bifidobacteriaceae bacterium]|nr:hypothetical protein [Bifidobacteriaceae bacterium]
IASALCPNPKGVGPMTRANLLKNLCFIKQLEYMTAFENSEFEQSS